MTQRGTVDEVFVIKSHEGAAARTSVADRGTLAPIHALAAATLADIPPNPKALAVMLAAYAPQPLIVDDFPPYRFTGFGAVRTWAAGFEGIVAHAKIEHLRLHLATPEFVQRSGMRATLVIPMHVAFTSNGTPSTADGRWLFVLDRSEGPYRIVASVLGAAAALVTGYFPAQPLGRLV